MRHRPRRGDGARMTGEYREEEEEGREVEEGLRGMKVEG
jgi:hypothetical protein